MNEIKIENNEYWNAVNNSTVRLVEVYNPRKLDIMLNNWSHPLLQKALLKSTTEEGTDSEDDMTAVNTLFSHLKSYRKKSKCRVGATDVAEFETSYNQTGKTKIKSGRYFAKGSLSLQSFKKVIKETISDEFYYDIDMVNCHPSIALQYCEKNNISVNKEGCFYRYVKERDKVISELQNYSEDKKPSRDALKKVFLTILNGGRYKPFMIPEIDNTFTGYITEINSLLEKVKNINEGRFKASKSSYSDIGSICNKVWCDIENTILFHTFNYLSNMSEIPSVLSFDGIMIRNIHDREVVEAKLEGLSAYVKDKTGYSITFKIKNFENVFDLTSITDGQRTAKNKEDFLKLLRIMKEGELGASNIFFEIYGKENIKILSKSSFYVYDSNEKIWKNYEDGSALYSTISTLLLNWVDSAIEGTVLGVEEEKNIFSFRKSLGTVKMSKSILNYISSYDKCLDLNFRTNNIPYLLPIKHCRKIDLRTLEISERTREDFFSTSLDVYIENDSKKLESVETFLLEIMNGEKEEAEHLKGTLGYSITGETREKMFQIWYGMGNNGKSTLANMVLNIMGNYGTSISQSVISKGVKKSSANPELIALKDKHIGFLNENDSDTGLNSENIKQLASGGMDKISIRGLYKNQEEYIFKIKPILNCNNKPQFDVDDRALISRLRFIPFKARFEVNKENCDKVDYIKGLKDAFFTILVRSANSYYTTGKLPNQTSSQTELLDEIINDNDILGQFISEHYEIKTETRDEKVRTSLSIFRALYNQENPENKLKSSKIKELLKKKGFEVFKSNTEYIRNLKEK